MTAFEILKLFLIMGGILLVIAAIFGTGLYLLARSLTGALDRQRGKWAQTANALGLEFDPTSTISVKPLVGVFSSHRVKLLAFRHSTGESSYENHVSCEVFFEEPLGFSFLAKPRPRLLQELASVFTGYDLEIGVPSFDNAYHVETESIADLRKMLIYEPDNGMQPSLLTDMFLIQKRSKGIEATDAAIKVTVEADVDQLDSIKKGINDAVMLIERFRAAREATRSIT